MQYESFNKECVTIKEAWNRYLLSKDEQLKRVRLLLNWCPSKSATLLYKSCYFNTFN